MDADGVKLFVNRLVLIFTCGQPSRSMMGYGALHHICGVRFCIHKEG